jgi:hypothetical protein
MPYLIQVRTRAKCPGGIEAVVAGSKMTDALSSSTLVGGGDITRSTRDLRGDLFAAVSWTDGMLTGGFAMKRASAA